MINKLIITEYQNKITSVLYSEGIPLEIRIEDRTDKLHVGDIFIGRIKDLPKGIDGAFVEIGSETCYYPLNELETAFFTHKQSTKPIVCGDEIVFQVQKEAIKTKAIGLTTKISITGRYLVYEPGCSKNSISSRINEPVRSNLKKLYGEFPDTGYIIRTNAANTHTDIIIREAFNLKEKYDNIIKAAMKLSVGDCLYSSDKAYHDLIEHAGSNHPNSVITDIPRIHEDINKYIQSNSIDVNCELYTNKKLPLSNLYSIDRLITDCFHETVWLKSGGYLVIQHTEALTVIDVNTGKASKTSKNDLIRSINREAALKIPYEMRLRNLSGIILVDFINMEDKTELIDICKLMEAELRKDPVPAKYIDTTSLQLVELVREKKRRPIVEYFKD